MPRSCVPCPVMTPNLLAFEVKAQTIALRLRLLRERQRAADLGWGVPSRKEILRKPTVFEVPLMITRFLDVKASTTLVDVGANTGYWAERFRRFVPATYVAIEPDPRAFAMLSSRFPSDQLHHAAAGAEPGRMRLNLTSESVYSTAGTYLDDAPIQTDVVDHAEVDVIQLDSLSLDITNEQIVVKIDVQGFEPEVLRGAGLLLPRATAVIVEAPLWPTTEHEDDLGVLATLLREHGLTPVYFALAGLHRDSATIPVEFDVIFARPERRRML